LTKLSEAAAESLSKHGGEYLFLGFKDRSSAGIKCTCLPVLTDVDLDEASKKIAKGVNNVFVIGSKTE
jgi:hypothetical protein